MNPHDPPVIGLGSGSEAFHGTQSLNHRGSVATDAGGIPPAALQHAGVSGIPSIKGGIITSMAIYFYYERPRGRRPRGSERPCRCWCSEEGPPCPQGGIPWLVWGAYPTLLDPSCHRLLMARKRGSNMNKYSRVPVATGVDLGALVAGDLASAAIGPTMKNEGRVSSVELAWSLRDLSNEEGPIYFGVAHPDYTSAEIEESVEADVTGPGQMIERERGNRLVRMIGVFSGQGEDEKFNDGRPVKTKLNWVFQDASKPLAYWAYNISTVTLTTGARLVGIGHLNVFWQ